MQPSEIRKWILDDHRDIEKMLDSIELMAWRVIEGETWPITALRHEAGALFTRMGHHIEWEDVHLKPALERIGGLGHDRVRKLDRDHRVQRILLGNGLVKLRSACREPATLARNLLDLIQMIREDMRSEEALLISEDVLRDPPARSPARDARVHW